MPSPPNLQQHVLVVFFIPATRANTLPAIVVVTLSNLRKAYAKAYIEDMAKQRTVIVVTRSEPLLVAGSDLKQNGDTQASIYHTRNHFS